MSQKTRILVAGATGLTGRAIIQQCSIHFPEIEIKALVRAPVTVFPDSVQQIVADYAHLEDVQEAMEAETVICCLGTTRKKAGSVSEFRKVDVDYPLALGKRARFFSNRFILVSSAGAGKAIPNTYLNAKRDVEKGLMSLGFSSLHIFRPGFLDGPRQEKRSFERIALRAMKSMTWALPAAYKPMPVDTLAMAILQAGKMEEKGIFIYENEDIPAIAQGAKVKKNTLGLGI